MVRKSLIDDVSLVEEDDKGYPILFTNTEIRRMLNLAEAEDDDIFYDLGSGWGQNLIIALTEFNVKRCVGIEKDKFRCEIANKRLKDRMISPERGITICGKFENLFKNKLKGADLCEATIVFYGLGTDKKILKDIKKNLRDGCRLVYYYNCLFPEIKPDKSDYPFFVSIYPFKKPKSELDWLTSVINKPKSSLNPKQKPSTKELWAELFHDYDSLLLGRDYVKSYQRRLRQ